MKKKEVKKETVKKVLPKKEHKEDTTDVAIEENAESDVKMTKKKKEAHVAPSSTSSSSSLTGNSTSPSNMESNPQVDDVITLHHEGATHQDCHRDHSYH